MRNGNRIISITLLAFFVAGVLLTFNAGVGLADTANVTVNVTVASLTEITVFPINLTWTAIIPGSTGKATEGVYKNLTITNTGSTNASNLYGFMSTLVNESVYPYSGTAADLYAAGGVVVFKNESETSNMSWAGRLEWNWSSPIANTVLTGLGGAPSFRAEGFIRNATKQFYWALFNGTNGTAGAGSCNNSGVIFALSDSEDNGTTITRTPVSRAPADSEDQPLWAYFSITSGPLRNLCVAVDHNCTKIYLYKYDKRTSGGINANACANSNYIHSGNLVPTQSEKIQSDVWMPKGVPAGAMKPSWWTFAVG